MVQPGLPGRLRMYSLVIGYVSSLKIPRFAINTLIPFIVADLGLPAAFTPRLLAPFHYGYILSQIPGGVLAKRWGSVRLGSCQLALCAVILALVPGAGSLRGSQRLKVLAMTALMTGLGIFQGPMSPVTSQLNRAWMPAGVERAIAFRATGLAHSAAPLFGALITTRLGARAGWRSVCMAYAAGTATFTLLWTALARDRPEVAAEPAARKAATRGVGARAGIRTQPRESETRVGYWDILLVKPSLALGVFHMSFNFMDATRFQLSPTIYMERFHCSPVQMGTYLAIGHACHIPANFVWGALESWAIRRGTSMLTIRRLATGVGSVFESVLALGFAFAPNPVVATILYGTMDAMTGLHGSGAWANYMEVGGEDTSQLNAFYNTIACSVGGPLVPFLGFWLRGRTGSWVPQIALAASLKLLSGAVYFCWASVKPARQLIYEQRQLAREGEARSHQRPAQVL